MSSKDKFLNGTSIAAAAKSWHVNHQLAGKEIAKRTLRRRKDGTLEFQNGSPVRAGELLPGESYTIIEQPGEKK